jgi:hypothetical protein
MATVVRRIGIAFGSSAVAWLAGALLARWLFGSGNILVWLMAGFFGLIVYLAMLWRDRPAR